jgi:uncharacterized protein YcfL
MQNIIVLIMALLLVGCSVENENVNNINQPNGIIIEDDRGPELKQIENKIYKQGENYEKKKIKIK